MSGLLIFLGVLANDAHFDLKLAFLFYEIAVFEKVI